MTEAEYLALERRADFKSEFCDGELFAMAGGSPIHSLIATNLAGELRSRLKGRNCVPYSSDLRLKIEATGLFTYPDLSVVCGSPAFAEGQTDTITNPTLLAEVLSDSTEAYDRGKKFEHYRQIPALREFLLLSQKEARVEQFVRSSPGEWSLRDAAGLEGILTLVSLNVTLPLAELYANVNFVPASIRPPSSSPPMS